MVEESALGKSVDALNLYFLGDATMSETLTRVSQAALIALPQADSVGITMMVDSKVDTYVFTHPLMPEIDRAQYESSSGGPCVDAWKDAVSYSIADTRTSVRWPEFCATAAAHGVRSTLSVPMIAEQRSVGAMNFYANVPGAFTDDDQSNIWAFASHGAYLLMNAQAMWDARSLGENLTAALASRAVIEQAKGIIIATRGVTADEAFESLVKQSQHENHKLRDIAAQIVRSAERRSN